MKNFVRVKENFVCEKCGAGVAGDGYTDHCPKCLWGKHRDEEVPGDRKSGCGGMMEPVKTEYINGKFRINYRCLMCGKIFWVREGIGDNRDELLRLGAG